MKPKSNLRLFLALAGSSLLAISFAHAADLFWDGNDTTADADGGAGTWDTTLTNWDDAATGGSNATWDNVNNDIAIFGGTAGTVSLGTGITVGGLTFNTDGYLIQTDTLTFGAAGSIFTDTGVSATISSILAGSAAIEKTGAGTLTLSGTNTYTGDMTVSAGTLLTTKAAALPGYNVADRVSVASGANLSVNAGTGAWSAAEITGLLSASPFAFASGSNLGIVNTGAFTLEALRGGSYTIIKQGAGTMTLGANADSSFTGSTIDVTDGTLHVPAQGRLSISTSANATTVNVGANGILSTPTNGGGFFKSSGSGSPSQLINLNGGRIHLRVFAATDYGGNIVTTGGTIDLTTSGTPSLNYDLNSLSIGSGTLSMYMDDLDKNGSHNIRFLSGTTVTGSATLESTKPALQPAFANTNLGALSIGNHTLTTQGGGNFTAAATTLTGAATFSADGPGLLTLGAVTGGVHNFTKSGAGVLNLSGAGTGSGTYTVNGGVLRLSAATSIPGGIANTATANILTLDGGVLELGSGNFTRNLGSAAGQFQITDGESGFSANGGGRTVTVNNNAATVVQWDSASFAPDTFVLNAATANNTLLFSNRLDLYGDGVATTRNIAVMANTATMSGIIENTTANTIGLTKSGNGTLVLSNAGNSYDGDTTVSGGTLTLGASGALPSGNNVVLNGGTLSYGAFNNTAGTLTLDANSTIVLGTGSLSFASAVNDWTADDVTLTLTGPLGAATTSLRFGTDSTGLTAAQLARVTYNGLASGVAKPVTLDASGYIRSTAYDGSWTGSSGNWSDTTKWSNAIVADGEDATATGASHTSGLKTITLDSNRTIGYLSLHASSANNFQINGTDILTLATSSGIPRIRNVSRFGFSNINVTLAGNDGLEIGDTSLGIENGSIKLTGNNTYTGGTKLTASTLLVGHVNALGSSTVTFNGGGLASSDATAYTFANTIALTGNVTIGQWHSNNPGVGTGNMSFTDTATTALGATRTFTVGTGITATFAQSFTGTSNTLTKAGAGTLVLTGNNSGVTGGTTLSGGTLILSGSTALPAGTVTWGTTNTTLQFENDSNLAITNTLATSARSLNRTLVVDRLSSGAAVNLSFSSQPNLDCGTVFNFQAGSDITSGTPTITFQGGTTSSDSNNGTIAGGTGGSGAIRFNPTGVNVVINGIGSSGRTRGYILDGTSTGNRITGTWANGTGTEVHKNGSGTWTLAGVSQYTLKTTINNGTLQFEKQTALYNNTAASWTAANLNVKSGGTLAFNVGGTGEFTTGNVTTLLTNLADSSSATSGMNAGSNFGFDTTNASGGTFTIADVIANSTGASGGARGLTKLGTNTLVLTNTNTYTGATTISAGTLALGADDVLADTSAISIGAATLNAATFTDTVGTLDVTNTAAVINLGSGGALAFADSSAVDWTDILGNLDITGTFVSGSSIRFGTTSGGLTSGQLAVISVNGSGAGTYSLDSSGYLVTGGSPTITLGGTLAAVDTTYGTASPTPTSFTVSGSDLTGAPGNLTVTPPSGFEVSLTIGSGYTTSLSVPYATSTLSATDVYVRLSAATAFGTYSGNVTVSGGGASTQNIATASSSVAKKALSVTAPTIASKPYDGTTTAGAVNVGTLSGFVGIETVTATATAANYSSANVGTYTGNVVTYVLANGTNGGLAANYSLADDTATGTIVKADQTITFTALPASVPKSNNTQALVATATSGLTVDFASSNTTVADVTGSTLNLNQGGSITVTATQAGNANYNPAPPVPQNLIITGYTAVADAVTRPTDSAGINIPIASLLANDGAVDSGGNVTPSATSLTSVTSGTGNTVTISGAFVQYVPTTPGDSADLTFTYVSTDGTESATATVTVSTVAAGDFTLDIVEIVTAADYDSMADETTVTIEFAGVPNQNYEIQYSTDMTNWSDFETFPTGAHGTFNATFTAAGDFETAWNNGMFFRAKR